MPLLYMMVGQEKMRLNFSSFMTLPWAVLHLPFAVVLTRYEVA